MYSNLYSGILDGSQYENTLGHGGCYEHTRVRIAILHVHTA
jgi:hypothetical protein